MRRTRRTGAATSLAPSSAISYVPICFQVSSPQTDNTNKKGCVDSDKWLKLVVNKLNGIHEEVGLGQRERGEGGFSMTEMEAHGRPKDREREFQSG